MTDQETQQLIELLEKVPAGYLPEGVFVNIARLAVLTAIEFVPLRYNQGKIEVLLLPRPSTDPIWPNLLHTPGTILRSTDNSFEDAFKRLCEEEIGVTGNHKIIFTQNSIDKGQRGSAVLFEHILIMDEPPLNGKFYDVQNLPENVIPEMKDLIYRAAKQFEKEYA